MQLDARQTTRAFQIKVLAERILQEVTIEPVTYPKYPDYKKALEDLEVLWMALKNQIASLRDKDQDESARGGRSGAAPQSGRGLD